jgi:hypothetical protein
MSFTSETKVKEIALSNPAARQILEDAGLDYCLVAETHCMKPACMQMFRLKKS